MLSWLSLIEVIFFGSSKSFNSLIVKCFGLQQKALHSGWLNILYLPVYPRLNQKAIRGADWVLPEWKGDGK